MSNLEQSSIKLQRLFTGGLCPACGVCDLLRFTDDCFSNGRRFER